MAIVQGAADHNGLEAWRLLHEWYQPKTRSRGLALLNEILGWDFGTKEQFLQRLKEHVSAEAKRLGALETKSVIRKTLEVYAASVREICDWSGLLADSNVKALEVDRRAGGKSAGSELPNTQRMEKGVAKFLEKTAPGGSLERCGRRDVQNRWYACGCAHFGLVRSISPTGGNAVTQTLKFPHTNGKRGSELGDTTISSDWNLKERNWRSGRHDPSRFKTMSVDGAIFRKASAQPELRRVLVAVPSGRRKPAGAHGIISRRPLWSFGGQGRKFANAVFSPIIRDILCILARARRGALATSIIALNSQKSPTFAKCDTTLRTASFDFF